MTGTQPSFTLPAPKPDQAYIEVSALEAGIIHLPLWMFVKGASPDEISVCPSLAFSLRHRPSGAHLLFDLGMRRDTSTYAPAAQALITKWMPCEVPQSVEESLRNGGIEPAEVETVVLSHLHYDHVGDHSSFSKATFILGEGSREVLDGGFPANPTSDVHQNTVPLDRTRFLTATDFGASIGPFPRAHDYFGDGSLYIVDAIGHLTGHVNVLARTSSDGAWIYLGGDSAHDIRLITGEREIATLVDPASGHIRCAHAKREDAEENLRRIHDVMKLPRVQVLIAHDREWYEKNRGGSAFLPGKIPPAAE